MATVFETLVELVKLMAVLAVVAYLVSRTDWFFEVCNRRITRNSAFLTVAIFAMMAILGNYSGVEIFGAIANVRDPGPMMAGLLGGPVIGFTVGMIGATYRYFMGGFSDVPSALSTVISGTLGGLVWLRRKKLIGPAWAAAFAFSMETLHMVLTLAMTQPFSEAVSVVKVLYPPMALTNSISMAIFTFIVGNVTRERNMAIEKERLQQELTQKEIRIRELEIGRLKKYSSDLEATVAKLEIVIDEEHVRKEAEKIMGTDFFKDLLNQLVAVKRVRSA